MGMSDRFWKTITESTFPWEREALQFVRTGLPDHEPYLAWSNFEFIGEDGSINEVDLLVFTPQGFFLVEIKSRPGLLRGDAGTWTWENEGRRTTVDSPLFSTDLKAKKLIQLLQRQRGARGFRLPFVEPLVFCSAPSLQCELQGPARSRVCLRDKPDRPGILAALMRRDGPGLPPIARGTHDRPMARAISQAMEQAGVRPSQRARKVGDYRLESLIQEGPGYQDWAAKHVSIDSAPRRVRIYLVRSGTTVEDRKTLERAALREYQILEMLQHPQVLRACHFTEHQLGPAILFEHAADCTRLDLYLAENSEKLSPDLRLRLIRQIAEAVRFAHGKKVVHRALSPQSVLVFQPHADVPQVKLFNWQVGFRRGTSTSGVSQPIPATAHVERLVEDVSLAYMAPEAALPTEGTGEHLDVFSLGAIAYHLFSGRPPAANALELANKLKETKGLQLSSVMNGAGQELEDLIRYSTHPDVSHRIDSARDFIERLELVENEWTEPAEEAVTDPEQAQKGDKLAGGFEVVRRLGIGATSVVLQVRRDETEFVLKIAHAEYGDRIRDEAQVLEKLRHSHIVEFQGLVQVGNRPSLLLGLAGPDTLAERLRREGRLHVEMLQRFGEDLLQVVQYLEEKGIAHRDIKPDNIAVAPVGRGDKLHLVLFDFSLSRTPPENISAGTPGYLDPFLSSRRPRRWDLYAERFAAAITLYEMATGTRPKWGDGQSHPDQLDCEASIEAELFPPHLRDSLAEFFKKALKRDARKRHDNAEEMLRSWRAVFERADRSPAQVEREEAPDLEKALASATPETYIPELALSTRAMNALDRVNILTVRNLLSCPIRVIARLRGVGNKTRREILRAVSLLRGRLGPQLPSAEPQERPSQPLAEAPQEGLPSVDVLVLRLLRGRPGGQKGTEHRALLGVLGLSDDLETPWPSQVDVAHAVGVTRARVGQLLAKALERWGRDGAMTRLRGEIVETLAGAGGVMSHAEVAEAILVARGSLQDEPARTRAARAVVRAATELERSLSDPRFLPRREERQVWIATTLGHAEYAMRLGRAADKIAQEDPLVPPARALEELRRVELPQGVDPPVPARLLRLAVQASARAALSSNQELYPRGMDALRALRLSPGALAGAKGLRVEQIRERVGGRYPEASPLPDRPALDSMLQEVGFEGRWDPDKREYVLPERDPFAISSVTTGRERSATAPGPVTDVSPEVAVARQFEERLRRAVRDGAFLALTVPAAHHDAAREELCRRFPVQAVDFENLFLRALKEAAARENIDDWQMVLEADAAPRDSEDWRNLVRLIGRALPSVEQEVLAADRTVLIVYPGPLARYQRMDLLERLRDRVGRPGAPPGLWVLIPSDDQHDLPTLDGCAVPVLTPGQRARIPEAWVYNRHRAAATSA